MPWPRLSASKAGIHRQPRRLALHFARGCPRSSTPYVLLPAPRCGRGDDHSSSRPLALGEGVAGAGMAPLKLHFFRRRLRRPPRRFWASDIRAPEREEDGTAAHRLVRHDHSTPLSRFGSCLPALKVSLVLTAGHNAGGRFVGASRPGRIPFPTGAGAASLPVDRPVPGTTLGGRDRAEYRMKEGERG
jgi:hypothetical protein